MKRDGCLVRYLVHAVILKTQNYAKDFLTLDASTVDSSDWGRGRVQDTRSWCNKVDDAWGKVQSEDMRPFWNGRFPEGGYLRLMEFNKDSNEDWERLELYLETGTCNQSSETQCARTKKIWKSNWEVVGAYINKHCVRQKCTKYISISGFQQQWINQDRRDLIYNWVLKNALCLASKLWRTHKTNLLQWHILSPSLASIMLPPLFDIIFTPLRLLSQVKHKPSSHCSQLQTPPWFWRRPFPNVLFWFLPSPPFQLP